MAFQMKAVAFNIGLGIAGSTVTVPGAGFTPAFAMFLISGRTENVDTAGRQSHFRSIGMAGGGQQRVACTRSADNVAAGNLDASIRTDSVIVAQLTNGNVEGRASLTSFNSDGCTLTIDDNFASNYRVIVLFMG